MKTYVFCPRISSSAEILRKALKGLGIRSKRLRGLAPPRWTDATLINWGATEIPYQNLALPILNRPDKVGQAVNKVTTLGLLEERGLPVITVTDEPDEAQSWLQKGKALLARKDKLSNGRGITVVRPSPLARVPDLPEADFYSKIYPKTHEFRIHVLGGLCIDFTQKKHQRDHERQNLIRTHDNGWVFAHNDISLTDQRDMDILVASAIESCRILELDFAAVDILTILTGDNPRRLKSHRICEVNTAPGLENLRTINAYATGFQRLLQGAA